MKLGEKSAKLRHMAPAKKRRERQPQGQPGWIRAAISYSGWPQDVISAKINVHVSTLGRWGRGIGPAPSERLMDELALVCEVPSWLLHHGFVEPALADASAERLHALEQAFRALADRVAQLEAQVQDAGGLAQAEGAFGHALSDDPPSEKRPRRTRNPEGEGKRANAGE